MSAVTSPRAAPGSLRAWILAIRPATLTVGLSPVLVGAAVASSLGEPRILAIAAALLGAIFLQIGSNLANDVFDHEKGADGPDRLGPVRVTQAGLLSPSAVRVGMGVAFALAMATGIYLTNVAGWPIVAIGLASIASAIAYTGGPYPLGYHGLGDVFVFVFFGLVAVCGTAFVATGGVPVLAWFAAVPVGSIATCVLVVNNVRDRETDVRAGKRTLAVRFGRRFGVAEYALLLVAAYAVPVVLFATRRCGALVLLPLLTLPIAARLALTVARRTDGPTLNSALASTARLLLFFSVLFAAGLAMR
jgi:1,4-dihydroxy-2-naphthoate polyprenyltransferase